MSLEKICKHNLKYYYRNFLIFLGVLFILFEVGYYLVMN